MKNIDLAQLKIIETEMLDYLHALCEENGITYFMDSGTLLGAVRHKGFIPWDDDIDLVLPRADYAKLIEIVNAQNGRYKVLCNETDAGYCYTFGKLIDTYTSLNEETAIDIENLGVYIDLFPLDHLPDGTLARRIFHEHLWIARYFWGASVINNPEWMKKGIKNKLVSWYAKKRGWRHWVNKVNKIVLTRKYKNSRYMANIVGTNNRYRCVEASVFQEKIKLEFEGRFFYAPKEYDAYLTNLYGDYRKLPPKEKQVTHHKFKAFYK